MRKILSFTLPAILVGVIVYSSAQAYIYNPTPVTSSGSGGSVSTSSAVTTLNFPFWNGTTGALSGSSTISSSASGSIAISNQYYSTFTSSTASTGATTVNWNNGNVQSVLLQTSTVFSFSNVKAGARYLIALQQDGTGSRTVTWPATVNWPSGAAPTLTTSTNKLDIVTFVCLGVSSTNCYAGANLNYSP